MLQARQVQLGFKPARVLPRSGSERKRSSKFKHMKKIFQFIAIYSNPYLYHCLDNSLFLKLLFLNSLFIQFKTV